MPVGATTTSLGDTGYKSGPSPSVTLDAMGASSGGPREVAVGASPPVTSPSTMRGAVGATVPPSIGMAERPVTVGVLPLRRRG